MRGARRFSFAGCEGTGGATTAGLETGIGAGATAGTGVGATERCGCGLATGSRAVIDDE